MLKGDIKNSVATGIARSPFTALLKPRFIGDLEQGHTKPNFLAVDLLRTIAETLFRSGSVFQVSAIQLMYTMLHCTHVYLEASNKKTSASSIGTSTPSTRAVTIERQLTMT